MDIQFLLLHYEKQETWEKDVGRETSEFLLACIEPSITLKKKKNQGRLLVSNEVNSVGKRDFYI